MGPGNTRKRSLRASAVAAALVGAVAFANSLGNGFAYDDRLIIAGNEDIQSLETLPGTFVKPYWPNRYGRDLGLWRPITTWVFGVQWALWDGHPAGFHLVNVALYGLSAALVVLLLGQLLPMPAALVAGLLFAVHPVHAEAVANVVGLSEVLCANLYLGACLLVVRSTGRTRPGVLAAVAGLFLAAMLVKESAVTLPGAVFLLDAARRNLYVSQAGRYLKERWPLYSVLTAVLAGVLMARVAVLGSVAGAFPPLGAEILADGEVPRIWTVLATWPEVFRLLLFPLDLSADYSPEVIPVVYGPSVRSTLGVVLGLGTLAVAWCTWRTGRLSPDRLSPRALGFGILWFLITVLPTSNLLFLTGVLLAERTLFLPSVGFAAGVGWILVQLTAERARAGIVATVVTLTLLGCRTIVRNPAWRDSAAVFDTLLRDHPESGRAQWLLGDLYFNRRDHERGLDAYTRAIGMLGASYTLLSEIGRRLLADGFDAAGRHVLREAWTKHPEHGLAPGLLAVHYDRHRLWTLAEEASRAALAAEPDNPIQAHLLARALAAQGRFAEAIEARMEVVDLGEDRPEQWVWLAELRALTGDTAGADANLDSARLRAGTERQVAAVDSLQAVLGTAWKPRGDQQDEGLKSPD